MKENIKYPRGLPRTLKRVLPPKHAQATGLSIGVHKDNLMDLQFGLARNRSTLATHKSGDWEGIARVTVLDGEEIS